MNVKNGQRPTASSLSVWHGGKVQSQDFEVTERALRGVSGADIQKLCVGDLLPILICLCRLRRQGRFRLSEGCEVQTSSRPVYPLNWEDLSARRVVELQAQRDKYVSLSAECVTAAWTQL
jgi:hypothetical protein